MSIWCEPGYKVPTLVDLSVLLLLIFSIPEPRLGLAARLVIWLIEAILVVVIQIFLSLRPLLKFLKITIQSRLTSAVIAISTLAPRTGRYIDTRNIGFGTFRKWFDQRIGNEMVEHRDQIRFVFCRNRKFDEVPKAPVLLAEISRLQRKIRRRHTYGEITIGALGSLVAIGIGQISFLGGLLIVLSVFLFLLPFSMFLRDVVIDTLAYSAERVDAETEEMIYRPPSRSLIFMREWNRLLLRDESIIHRFIFVGFLRGEFPGDVERGIQLMETVVAGEMNIEDALDDMILEELGEETWEARALGKILRRYFGI